MNSQRDDFSIAWSGMEDDVVTIDTENPPSHQHDGQKGMANNRKEKPVLFSKKGEGKAEHFYEEEVVMSARTESMSPSSIKPKRSSKEKNNNKNVTIDTDEAKNSGHGDNPDSPCCRIFCCGRRVTPCFFCILIVVALLAVAGAAFGGSVLAYFFTQEWK